MSIPERVYVLFIVLLSCSACAPVTEGAQQVGRQIGQSVTGSQIVVYQTDAWMVVSSLAGTAFQIQPSHSHTPMLANNLTDHSLTLNAKPASGSAATATLGTAKPISIQVDCLDKEGMVEVTLTPTPPDDVVARETVKKVIAKLDYLFDRQN